MNLKGRARSVLAIVVATFGIAAGATILPQGRGLAVPDAAANEPTPLITSIDLPDPVVLPSPIPSPAPSEDPDKKNRKDKKDGKKGQGSGGQASDFDHEDGDIEAIVKDPKTGGKRRLDVPVFVGVHRAPGAFNSDRLLAIATRLRALGWSEERVHRRVYSPFILAGESAWIDTWGAVRHGPEPEQIRSHEGQDVFCEEGTPVLATERGTIEFAEGGLGGRVARLYREDGSYWYYAHLLDWNQEAFASGDEVEVGDVIGYCGRTGNAQTTPAHVHFGWYEPDGAALDPFDSLGEWLEEAEEAALSALKQATSSRIPRLGRLTTARRFGDWLAPTPGVYLGDEELRRLLAARVLDHFAVRGGVADPHHHDHNGTEDSPVALFAEGR